MCMIKVDSKPWEFMDFRSAAGRPTSLELVKKFEQVIGSPLPPEYRSFILVVNGGRPQRRVGDLKTYSYAVTMIDWEGREPAESDPEAVVHYLYVLEKWDGLFEDSRSESLTLSGNYRIWVKEEERFPPEFISVGSDPGGSQFLLKIAGEHCGAVYFWARGYFDPDRLETDPMHNIGFVAPTFDAFIENIRFED